MIDRIEIFRELIRGETIGWGVLTNDGLYRPGVPVEAVSRMVEDLLAANPPDSEEINPLQSEGL